MADGKAKLVAEVVGEYSAGQMFSAANKDMARTAKQGKALNNQMRLMRGGVGQLGHQFQDIAVQLQGGQSPFIVLGQQGSQIVSLMGPHGAMVGAIVAVGAAIAGSMLPNLFGAVEALQDVEKEAENLVDRFNELDGVLKVEAIRQVTQALENNKEAIADAEKEIEKLNRVEEAHAEGQGAMTISIEEANKRIQEQERNIALLEESNVKLARSIDGTSDATEKLIESLESKVNALGKTQRALDLEKASTKGATQADLDAINALHDQKDAYDELVEGIKAEQKALDEAAKAEEKRNADLIKNEEALTIFFFKENEKKRKEEIKRAEEQKEHEQELADFFIKMETKKAETKQQLDAAMLSQAGSLAGGLADIIAEGKGKESAAYKAAFAVQQGIAIASTIMNTKVAAAAALAPPPIGLGPLAGAPYATMIEAMGAASVGIIAGQTLASFEGGGLTGSGARSGGMDGKGGMLAMLHPNEKITDLHKGQGDSKVVNVNFSIQANDTAGFDRLLNSRRGQIVNMINQAVNDRGRPSIA